MTPADAALALAAILAVPCILVARRERRAREDAEDRRARWVESNPSFCPECGRLLH